jgi:GNAT superfamily N-acetyltransferase
VKFYHALIKLVRLIGGSVSVASVPTSTPESSNDDSKTDDIGAILLWLPPKKRVTLPGSILKLYTAGYFGAAKRYGLKSLYRVEGVFEGNVKAMFDDKVKSRGFDPADCGFVQLVAANPKFQGKGYANSLLKWQCERHFEEFKGVPVILDTTTERGIRSYVRLGFELLDQRKVTTGTDARGIKLKKDAEESIKQEADRICIQRVMIKMPDKRAEE